MKPTKDNFSKQAVTYQKFRPIYPQSLYDEILKHVPDRDAAWDCGTGNGQVAVVLAGHFKKVVATDISQRQLDNSTARSNIEYQCCRAERTAFPDRAFDLITVAQAIHWFDFDAFYQEVNRVGKPGAVLAVWGYGLLRINPAIDKLLDHFYKKVVGPYWDAERRWVDEGYATIPFPFEEIKPEGQFAIQVEWVRPELEGYLNTWSSVQQYISQNGTNPVDGLMEKISAVWGSVKRMQVVFPLFLRLGKIK